MQVPRAKSPGVAGTRGYRQSRCVPTGHQLHHASRLPTQDVQDDTWPGRGAIGTTG